MIIVDAQLYNTCARTMRYGSPFYERPPAASRGRGLNVISTPSGWTALANAALPKTSLNLTALANAALPGKVGA